MNAEHRHELERNELAYATMSFWERAKSGQMVNPRILGIVVAAILLLGVWWYLANSGQSAASSQWREFDQVNSKTGLEDFAKTHANTTSGRLAQLQLARVKFASEGLLKLNQRNAENRGKAITAIEETKAEFVRLAEEFKSDPTMKSQCLDLATKAELALVGVPKAKGSTESRGSVEVAVGHLRSIAETVGKETVAGKAAWDQAADLEKNRERVIDLGRELETTLSPSLGLPDINLPTNGLGSPALPPAPSPNLKLPEGVTPSNVPPPTPNPAPQTPPAAAVVGGAATATTPATKKP